MDGERNAAGEISTALLEGRRDERGRRKCALHLDADITAFPSAFRIGREGRKSLESNLRSRNFL
jgi:hypothetical protein